jgi:hypothetical protein
MKTHLIPIVAILAVAAMGGALAQEDTVTVQVAPKICEVSKIQPQTPRPWTATITYTVRNESRRVQVLNRYCTIGLEGSENGAPVPLRFEGRDGTRMINRGDIVVLKPGEGTDFTIRIYVGMLKDGRIILFRETEDGSSWTTGALTVPGEIRLTGTYDPALGAVQSGFKSVDREVEKFAREMAGTDFEMVGNLKLPAVTLTLVK